MHNYIKVLLVDDEKSILHALKIYLEKQSDIPCKVETVTNGKEAVRYIENYLSDIVLLDLKLPDINGLKVLEKIKSIRPRIPVIIMTGHGTIETAVKAMQAGAENYLLKPFKTFQEITISIKKAIDYKFLKEENEFLKEQIAHKYNVTNIIGKSPKMVEIFKMIKKIAPIDTNVLIEGESGTGKELVARAIHQNSLRAKNRFVAINCAAIPPNLFESELFGYEKGAFTGAVEQKMGYLDLAQGGTIFFDEISEMPIELQAKLLRVLQEKSYTRVGGVEELNADIRVIASTNKNLEDEILSGNFRHDLYYRINVVKIYIPPLRERLDDIPLLVNHFIDKYAKKFKKNITDIDSNTLRIIVNHRWDGNVRELENTIERAVALAETEKITEKDIPEYIKKENILYDANEYFEKPYNEAKTIFERSYFENVLKKAKGNISKAAEISKLPRQNIYEKLKKHSIDIEAFR